MKTFYQFLEALRTVGGIHLTPHGWVNKQEEDDGTVARNDRYFKAAGKTKVIPTLYEVLGRNSNFPIHIYFGTHQEIYDQVDTKSLGFYGKKEALAEKYDKYFFENEKFKIPRSDIVYVKEMIGGDVWTPWIVLHGLGHTLFDKKNKVPYHSAIVLKVIQTYLSYGIMQKNHTELWNYRKIYDRQLDFDDLDDDDFDIDDPDNPTSNNVKKNPIELNHDDIMSKISKSEKFDDSQEWKKINKEYQTLQWNFQRIKKDKELRNTFLASVFNFSSMRSNKTTTDSFVPLSLNLSEEFINELIPWFFFNSAKIPLPNDDVYVKMAVATGGSVEHIKRATVQMLGKIEEMIIANLEHCRGKVLID
jgi:hypothetical protein